MSEENPELSSYAVRLGLNFANWVHRRVETFEFVDAGTVRRRMSVDFTLPLREDFAYEQIVYVPIMLLEKEVLRHLDVSDQKGHSLSVLTQEQGEGVALVGLKGLLGIGGPGTEERVEALRKIIQRKSGPVTEGARAELKAEIELILGGGDGEIDALRKQIGALLSDLAGGFMLLVPMPYEPGARRVVKFSYDTRMRRPEVLRDLYWWTTRLAASVGLMGRRETFANLSPGWAQSYHAEVVPAADTYAVDTVLEDVSDRRNPKVLDRDDHPSRPHVRAAREGRGARRGVVGSLTLLLHARRDGLVFPLLFSAAVITGVLAFLPERGGELDGITLGALLLAPFALAAYYARSAENSYVTEAMRGVRLIGTVPVLAGLGVIALVALGYLGCSEHCDPVAGSEALSAARWAARASALSTVVLFMALIGPRLGVMARRIGTHLKSDAAQVAGALAAVVTWLVIALGSGALLLAILPI